MAAVTEEPQVMSIQQRIAALNQSHVGRNPNDNDNVDEPPPYTRSHPAYAPPPPPVSRPGTTRNKTVNNPPSNAHGSVLDRSAIGNEPAAAPVDQRKVIRPPPIPGVQTPDPPADATTNGVKKKAPPPLPSRKKSMPQLAPALPARRPSAGSVQRKISQESLASDTSFSTVSTRRTAGTSSTSVDSNNAGRSLRAPAWGTTDLPPLPPKREEKPAPPPRPKSSGGKSVDSLSSKIKIPGLPRRASNSSISTTASTRSAPAVPPVPPVPRLPPRTGSYNNQNNSEQEEAAPKLPTRRLPPPPSASAVDKIRQSGFGGLNKSSSAAEPAPSAVPPPVPLSSRPDLTKLQATKPRMHASHPAAPAPAPSTVCLKCRDFSGPDTHAARYPRETLPSQNMQWLANELTAPFPSPTDKARALFTWLHHNISYDVVAFFNNNVKPSTPAKTLSTGLAVCEGYAGLLATLANHAGLEAVVISGHGKGYGYAPLAPGSSVPPFSAGHAWNAVRIDNGQWKLIDPCWGAGVCQGPGQPYQKLFSPENFTDSNDVFGIKHFPSNREHFYRDDGRPGISWEEYIMGEGIEQPTIFTDAKKHSIGEQSFQPAVSRISVYNHPGPIRFQFNLHCEHWTLKRHDGVIPSLFLLIIHGIDGRNDERIPFNHFRGTTPGGGGDFWYVDVADSRKLGAPGQKLQIVVLTSFGDRKDARGVTKQEYLAQVGRVGMAWAGIAQWELV
ncbi:hypothetical protein AWENTII_007548 [Aspergillus wentii]